MRNHSEDDKLDYKESGEAKAWPDVSQDVQHIKPYGQSLDEKQGSPLGADDMVRSGVVVVLHLPGITLFLPHRLSKRSYDLFITFLEGEDILVRITHE